MNTIQGMTPSQTLITTQLESGSLTIEISRAGTGFIPISLRPGTLTVDLSVEEALELRDQLAKHLEPSPIGQTDPLFGAIGAYDTLSEITKRETYMRIGTMEYLKDSEFDLFYDSEEKEFYKVPRWKATRPMWPAMDSLL